ncbi:Mu transposase C-terminal domain-containing protein [Stenotrophomonas maltophilia]|uniref:Mu transposase C-terminal domain-containing protein n=1 Tax=Stenotrophomonas maltophilia TaxID=40324 RepID=UPI003BF87FC3
MADAERNPISSGTEFVLKGRQVRIVRNVDLSTVLVQDCESAEHQLVKVSEALAILMAGDQASVLSPGFEGLSEDDWREASRRMAELEPLMLPGATREQAESIARQFQVHVATIYRWVKEYKSTGSIASLVPAKPDGGRGKGRIDPLTEAIVSESISELYLTKQRLSVAKLMDSIAVRCRRAKVVPPHDSTVRRRIAQLADRLQVERRHGRKAAEDKYAARPGRFPNADYPGAVWQIDHTPLDVLIVDDVHRLHVGRPWLTVAIDVYTRCIAGFYLSLDPPSEVSVGMCMVHAILPKEGWLAELQVTANWPVYGKPHTVHADNGKEFRSSMITRAAEQHRFRMEWRKVKTPNWGGHVERLIGTFNLQMHALPGTTFSNISKRGEYAPHKEAVFTLAELEVYLTNYICNVYHQKQHSSTGRAPLKMYEHGLLGDGLVPGRGLPPIPRDPASLRLDFMPLIERTIQQYGVQLDKISYYDNVLNPWIRAKDRETGKPRKFMFRRDPRDISVVYFLDPDTRRYYPLQYRNLQHPSMSLWELKEVKAQLVKEGRAEVDEALIFDTYERLSEMVDQAQTSSVKARKSAQKKRGRQRTKQTEAAQESAAKPSVRKQEVDSDWGDDEVEPFAISGGN